MKNLNKYFTLVALVFGDGYIQNRKASKKAYLDIAHHIKHSDYIDWKSNLINSLDIKNNIRIKNTKSGPQKRVTTLSYCILDSIRKRLYKNNQRCFPKSFVRGLDELALAILWMDDGCLCRSKKKRKDGQVYIYEFGIIATHAYDFNSQKNIICWLNKFGIDAYILKSKDKYKIQLNRDNLNKLITVIKPFVLQIPSMLYKVDI
jgi:hypothetical protein